MTIRIPYTPCIVLSADTGEPMEMFRPELPVSIHGPAGGTSLQVLVDTGADYCLFPEDVATRFGIPTQPVVADARMVEDQSSTKTHFAHVELSVNAGANELRWPSEVYFGSGETAIIGQMGFLEFFTATFDGDERIMTLEPNRHLPANGSRCTSSTG